MVALKVRTGMAYPPLSPAPPPSPAEVLFRVTDYAGPIWRELTIMKDRDGCLKKADYLGAQVLVKDG